MNTNQSLQSIIDSIPHEVKHLIMETADVASLLKLQKKHSKNADIVTVIDARIANINYLVL